MSTATTPGDRARPLDVDRAQVRVGLGAAHERRRASSPGRSDVVDVRAGARQQARVLAAENPGPDRTRVSGRPGTRGRRGTAARTR